MKPRLFKTRAGFEAFVQAQAARGHAWHVMIMHDNACSPSACRCSPWFEVRPMTAETVVDGAKRQARWIKETSS